MNRSVTAALAGIAVGFATSPADGQTLVAASSDRFAWTEAAGLLNLRPDSADPDAGVAVFVTHMRGFAWSESLGWVSFGRGPANGEAYGNTVGEDFGVNVLSDGRLEGFAWIESAGWINVGPLANDEVPAARIDYDALRLRGWAWGQAIGWVNLDDDEVFIALTPTCPPDINFDGAVTPGDFNARLIAFHRGSAICDQNGDGVCTPGDFNAWVLNYGAGC